MSGWADTAPALAPAPRELLRVLADVVNGRPATGGPVDWPAVFAQARRHHLDPFLAEPVCAWPADRRPPAPLLEAWRQALRVRAVAAVRLHEQLAEALLMLKQAGVAAIPLKGAWLAEHVYADIVSRPMCDIDLLIRPSDLEAATRALESAGYVAAAANRPGNWSKERSFRHPGRRAAIELQWQIWHSNHGLLPPLDPARLWAAAGRAVVAGVEVPVLTPAAHLVYLTYHIQAHQWRFPARAHLDIVLLGRRCAGVLTVDALAAEARAWGMEFRAPFVWRVAHDLCGVEPPAVLAGWAPTGAGWLPRERGAALVVALCGGTGEVAMSRLLCEYRQSAWWRRLTVGLSAWRVPPAQIRHLYPRASRWGGLAGGYAVRLGDLLRRRLRDLAPAGRRRQAVASASDDMSLRIRLERWLDTQDRSMPLS